MPRPAESKIPLNQYHSEVVNGERDPGHTGNFSRDEFITALRGLNFSQETIRCGECFELENLDCPGMLWLGNTVVEQTGETGLELACPLDVQESESKPPSIVFIINRIG